MFFKRLILGAFETNSYLLGNDDVSIVVDPAECESEMVDFLNSAKGERLILLTHAHCDHIKGASELRRLTGSKIAIHFLDGDGTNDAKINLSSYFSFNCPSFSADILLKDNEVLTFNNTSVTVLHTPGHTKGSACFIIDNLLISGDTLFEMSIGRTDFPGGSFDEIIGSLNKLSTLDESLKVCPGHGEMTTIGREKRNNPFLKGNRNEFM